MIGRSTKKPPPPAEDYARRDPGTWSSAAPPPQARRYGESRSAWEARRPKAGANAHASVYVPHFMQENVQRIPGKPFELRVHVRMKNKDLVHVFLDLTEDQTFLSLRELCRKTFPTFGRRLSALEWHADGQRVCPSFVADCLETIEEIGMEVRDEFLEGGGEAYRLIPCINSDDAWVSALHEMLTTFEASLS